jgi:large subunit ribosomal protein L15
MTHTSWKGGQDGHNARLAFVGRRVLAAYFNLFLHSCTGSALPSTGHTRFDEQHDYKALFERVMHTHQLGEYVGGAWKIEEVMRWLPANVDHAADGPDAVLRSTGLYKVRGVTVEAAMGGIYHQFGGAIAQRVFHTRILPHVSQPGLGLPEAFRGRATELCEEMGGLDGSLLLKGELLPPLPEQPALLSASTSASP